MPAGTIWRWPAVRHRPSAWRSHPVTPMTIRPTITAMIITTTAITARAWASSSGRAITGSIVGGIMAGTAAGLGPGPAETAGTGTRAGAAIASAPRKVAAGATFRAE